MNIQKLEVKNFKSIDFESLNLKGSNVFIVGANATGKTTLLQAARGQMTNRPLKEGKRKGEVIIELDDYTCEFTFTDKSQKGKLNIYDKTGAIQKKPATLFKELFGDTSFDIDSFLNSKAKDKVEKIKEIIGVDFTELDQERKKYYEERTFVNRKLAEFDAKAKDAPPVLDSLEFIPLDEIQKKISEASKKNTDYDRIKTGTDSVDNEIILIEKQIEILKDKAVELTLKKAKGLAWLSHNERVNVDELNEELNAAIQNNESLKNQENTQRIYDELEKHRIESEALTKKRQGIDEKKRHILGSKKMPVEGLTFDEDTLYLDGMPFETETINTAKRIIAGLQIQYHLNEGAHNRIACLDGSLLDKSSLKEVEEWATQRDIQLFIELVDRENEGLKIEISE